MTQIRLANFPSPQRVFSFERLIPSTGYVRGTVITMKSLMAITVRLRCHFETTFDQSGYLRLPMTRQDSEAAMRDVEIRNAAWNVVTVQTA